MKGILIFSFLISIGSSIAQTLNLPSRNPSAMNGDQVISAITSLSLVDRENYIMNEVLNGNVPDFIRAMMQVEDSANIGGTYKHITYYCIPDYLALGHDTNYYLCPMTPILGQRLADSLDCILPTRKMVNQIWADAGYKMNPESIPPSAEMITVPVMAQHNEMVWAQREPQLPTSPLGTGVSGDKKDVVISNLIYTSPAPRRVVIYGWHYPSGTNIQPLYAGQIDTYADYSHGIRLVQNACTVDGSTMLASDILMSGSLYPLLSDEGVISQPYYPDTTTTVTGPSIPSTPKSFVITGNDATSVRIKIQYDSNVDNYLLYSSTDGLSFTGPDSYSTNDFIVSGLTTNNQTFFRLKASNVTGSSAYSEVLGATPSSETQSMLIVNGFDRASTGNTYDFIRQHGTAVLNYGTYYASATNDAVIDGLVSLNDYNHVDYILGEESTADLTFSNSEQAMVKAYLNAGGHLFVSGAEIGWDLDHLGSTTDQDFYANYLKSAYVLDAPNDESSTHYTFEGLATTIFNNIANTTFDNGSNGTYNVDYPDVIAPVNGGISGLIYNTVTDNDAGIYFKGLFPEGTDTGKVVYFGFPFETIYPETSRFSIMENILDFFNETPETNLGLENLINPTFQVYPNPFTNELTIINKENENCKLLIYNSLGRLIFSINSSELKNQIPTSSIQNGLYWLIVKDQNGAIIHQQKLIRQ